MGKKKISETGTVAGAIAPVAAAAGGKKAGKLFKGVQTRGKFPNSKAAGITEAQQVNELFGIGEKPKAAPRSFRTDPEVARKAYASEIGSNIMPDGSIRKNPRQPRAYDSEIGTNVTRKPQPSTASATRTAPSLAKATPTATATGTTDQQATTGMNFTSQLDKFSPQVLMRLPEADLKQYFNWYASAATSPGKTATHTTKTIYTRLYDEMANRGLVPPRENSGETLHEIFDIFKKKQTNKPKKVAVSTDDEEGKISFSDLGSSTAFDPNDSSTTDDQRVFYEFMLSQKNKGNLKDFFTVLNHYIEKYKETMKKEGGSNTHNSGRLKVLNYLERQVAKQMPIRESDLSEELLGKWAEFKDFKKPTDKEISKRGKDRDILPKEGVEEAKKPKLTPQEKFKKGLKKAGYDADKGAKRIEDLIAKQKAERAEFEKQNPGVYDITESTGKKMPTNSFNDDDFYAFDPDTLVIKDSWGPKDIGKAFRKKQADDKGWVVKRGMSAKFMGLLNSKPKSKPKLTEAEQALAEIFNEGAIATVGSPDEGNHTGNSPIVRIGGSFPKPAPLKVHDKVKVYYKGTPTGEKGTIVKMDSPTMARVHIPSGAQGTVKTIPLSDLKIISNKIVKPMREVAKGKLNEFDKEGFEQYTLFTGDYHNQHKVEKFKSIEDAIEEVRFMMDADPRTKMSLWTVKDMDNNTVWEHDPYDIVDDMRRANKIQFRKPGKKDLDEASFDSAEYDDESGMAHNQLKTIARSVKGLMDTINDGDNLPEWVQKKLALAEDHLVTIWDYLQSEKSDEVMEQGVSQEQNLSIQQLATISDKALDNAYGYGRSTPGNSFGWQANLMSAAYAKKMIDAGATDIDQIADAIHKGWNVTAQKFVKNPDQFDDTEKLKAAGKLDAKLAQRQKLMKINYAQLDNEEQEKDRVVARALLQALRGKQDVAEGIGRGEYSRVLTALGLYYPRLSMEELNVPAFHKVIANKADVPVEYAAQVINDFVKANEPDDDEEEEYPYYYKDVSEARDGDTNFGSTVTRGSWVVYDGSKVKRFKSRDGAKAYAAKNGGKVASSEFYADNIQGKQGVAEGLGKNIKRAAQGWGGAQDKPANIVKRNKDYDTDTAKQIRAGLDDAPEHTPAGLQKRVLDRKLKGVAEGSMDDGAIWNRYGHYNTQDLMQEFPNLSPKDAESIVGNAERGWTDPTYKQKYRDNVVKLVKMAMGQQGVSEAQQCPECGGAAYDNEMIAEEKDACYSKVKSRYKVWPSAYASGALVKCRKVGAKNWGNKSKKK